MPLAYALNNNNLEVSLYKSKVVEMDGVAKRISIGNPGVADILILRGRQLYVVGKALGTTNVVVSPSSCPRRSRDTSSLPIRSTKSVS